MSKNTYSKKNVKRSKGKMERWKVVTRHHFFIRRQMEICKKKKKLSSHSCNKKCSLSTLFTVFFLVSNVYLFLVTFSRYGFPQ